MTVEVTVIQMGKYVRVLVIVFILFFAQLTALSVANANQPWEPILHTTQKAKNSETNLTPLTTYNLRLIEKLWPYYKTEGAIYGWRHDPIPDHPSGNALDIMAPADGRTADSVAFMDTIAEFIYDNAEELGVVYFIWKQRIRYPGGQYRLMDDRNDWTSNHQNHIHVLFKETSQPSQIFLNKMSGYEGQTYENIINQYRNKLKIAELNDEISKVNLKIETVSSALAINKNKCTTLVDAVKVTNTALADSKQIINQYSREIYMLGNFELLATFSSFQASTDPTMVRVLQTQNNKIAAANNTLTNHRQTLTECDNTSAALASQITTLATTHAQLSNELATLT